MTQAYTCHKCKGLLESVPDIDQTKKQLLPTCDCISSYVREWQSPITIDQALQERLEHSNMLLQLYETQGRHPQEPTVINELEVNRQLTLFLSQKDLHGPECHLDRNSQNL